MQRAVFLDRDGVLNRVAVRDGLPYPPRNVEEFELYDGVPAGCARLKAAGFLLVVVTNQPDVGRGTQSVMTVEAMHGKLRAALPCLDRIETCPHAGTSHGEPCSCRKPQPGMLHRAAASLGINLNESYLVGDRWRDVDCARAAGCKSVFIQRNYAEEVQCLPDFATGSFLHAVDAILRDSGRPAEASSGAICVQSLLDLPIKIFADGADLEGIVDLYRKPFIKGLTTNPTLMRKAGISDYEAFARSVLEIVTDKPISFEVFSDAFPEMRRQALKIRDWQTNVYVKIPVTNTKAESSLRLIQELASEGVKLNVTALLTRAQVKGVAAALNPEVPAVVSVFAGRVADSGVDPIPLMKESRILLKDLAKAELLWASVREVLNIFQAAACGCHVVTVPHEILAKAIKLSGADLENLSLDTVKMFYQDAVAAGFEL